MSNQNDATDLNASSFGTKPLSPKGPDPIIANELEDGGASDQGKKVPEKK